MKYYIEVKLAISKNLMASMTKKMTSSQFKQFLSWIFSWISCLWDLLHEWNCYRHEAYD